MDLLNVLLVDDEPIIVKRITKILEENHAIEVIGSAHSAEQFLELFSIHQPDFLIIDVDLPDKDGMELANEIREADPNIPIIFLTGHSEFAAESYLVNAIDYILKPFNEDRINTAMERVKKTLFSDFTPSWDRIEKLLKSPGRIVIKQEGNIVFLNMDQIFLVQKEGKLTSLLTFEKDGEKMCVSRYTTRTSMKEIHEQVDQNLFIRTHNSYIVNINWIHEVVKYSTEAYKINFKNTKEYALLNRNKLNVIVQTMM